jgi:DNA repair protein RecO (recombination protein O)
MQIKDTAICLRTVNYSETSQVVTLFTRDHGKIGAMAKGSRRAKSSFDGPFEMFSFGKAMFTLKESGGQLAIMTEFNQQPRFRMLSQNLNALNAALFGAELTERFLEDHDPHPPLFDKFIKFLETIQESKEKGQILAWLILYQLRLLEETGIGLMLNACVNCGTEINTTRVGTAHPTYFSSRENGLLCGNCEMAFTEKQSIDSSILDVLQNPAKLPRTEIKSLKKIEALLIYHFTELLHKPPRMAKYFS